MLVKVKLSQISIDYNNVILTIPSVTLNGGSGGDKTYTWTATVSGAFTITFNGSGSSSALGTLYVSVNGVNAATEQFRNNRSRTLNFTCNKGDTVVFGISGVSSNYYLYNSNNADLIQTQLNIGNPVGIIHALPQEIKNIGDLGICTLYGIHNDHKYYGGIITNTTNAVTTGSITLGNAVGFLEVNYNGNIVKIPYYT